MIGSVRALDKSKIERDLGIKSLMIDDGLTFSEHIHKTANKANGIMAVIRTFTRLDCKCFSLLFRSLVRPHLEYGVPVWFPYRVKDVYEVENVQKRATKQVRSLRHYAEVNQTEHADTEVQTPPRRHDRSV